MSQAGKASGGKVPHFLSRLRVRLAILMIVAMVPAVLLVLYMASQQYRKVHADVQENSLRLVRLAAADQTRQVASAQSLLLLLAGLADIRAIDPARCPLSLSHFLTEKTAFNDLALIDSDGHGVCSWPGTAVPEPVNPADAALARKAVETGRLAVGGYRIEAGTGSAEIHIAYPVASDAGRPAAALVLSHDLSHIGSLIRNSGLPEGAVMAIWNSEGRLLFRYPEPEQWIGKQLADTPLARSILGQQAEGVVEVQGLDGIPRLFAYTPLLLAESGDLLYVHLGMPTELAYQDVTRILTVALGGLAAAFIVIFALTWTGANVLVARPIGALATAARRLGGGDLACRTGLPHGESEIGQLAASFDEMAARLQAHQFELENLKFALDEHAIVSIAGLDGRITYVNDRFVEISRYSREELLGRDHRVLNSGHHDRAFFTGMWRTIGDGFTWHGVIRNRRKDGSFYWVATTIVPVLGTDGLQHQYISIRTEITSLIELQESLRQARDHLEEMVAQRTHELVLAKEDLEQDVERRQQAESELLRRNADLTGLNRQLAQAQSQLVQSEKLASIGQLAAGVAHEINNPIGFVQSNLGSLERYLQDLFGMLDAYEAAEADIRRTDPATADRLREQRQALDFDFIKEDIPNLMNESKDGIVRVRKIVQDLKDFSRVDSAVEWEFANIHKCLDSTLNIAHSEIKYKADVAREYGDLPEVECLPSQLNQVFMNLMVNAAHAMEGPRGTISLRTGAAGDEVWVEIADTGKGIAPENLGRIFDPFFTTKAVGKGTGLGLSLAYGIVQKHNGRIEVTSEVGKGTAFRVTIPVKHCEAAEAA